MAAKVLAMQQMPVTHSSSLINACRLHGSLLQTPPLFSQQASHA
jgi:hypothetical protein